MKRHGGKSVSRRSATSPRNEMEIGLAERANSPSSQDNGYVLQNVLRLE